jgi:predicted NAD/FAD-dependent oxidoreductase
MKIAIVGAGISGSYLAYRLDNLGTEVSVFEKSRGSGGRVSTKRTDWGQCDLGATLIPAKSEYFKHFMRDLQQQKIVSGWPSKIGRALGSADGSVDVQHFESDRDYFVFNQKMNQACAYWLDGINLSNNSLVTALRYIASQGWQIKIAEQWQVACYDKVVITAPWPQTQALLQASELPFSLPLANLEQKWSSCWSVGFKVNGITATDTDMFYLKQQAVQTLVRDSAKPFRPNAIGNNERAEVWVAQLSNDLSDRLGKEGKLAAIDYAKSAYCQLFEQPLDLIGHTVAHYWRYARPSPEQAPLGLISDVSSGLLAGGDWSFGVSIEAAIEAANAMFEVINSK